MTQEPLPSPRDFLLKTALYAEFKFVKEDGWKILDILYFAGTYDSYCTKCQRDSTFQCTSGERPTEYVQDARRAALAKLSGEAEAQPPSIKSDIYRVKANCTRTNGHTQDFLFHIEYQGITGASSNLVFNYTIQKIGQQPSYADVHLAKVKKYSTVLTKPQLSELNKAVGLASHGIGIGSYVYLRRIFEALVEEAHISAKSDANWNEENYGRSRMSEKIELVKDHLPTFLSENPQMYGLLSRGVHELSDEDCLTNFETLRLGIELILDEKLERKEKGKKIVDAKAALAKAALPKT